MTESTTVRSKQPPIVVERTLRAPPEEVWEMWTTKEGLEAWWGPEGFTSTVRALELRAGGRIEIVMRATDPEVAAYLESAGQETANLQRITLTEVVPVTRLAWVDRFEYAPDVEPYDVACSVTLEPVPEGTRLTLTAGGMHDDQWTQLATAGWNSSLDKLARGLERSTAAHGPGDKS
jgi:uncharacterized protein YndB with AHSA1/START domain